MKGLLGINSGPGGFYREVLRLESPFSTTSSSYVAVAGMTSSLLAAGTYRYHFYGIAQSTSNTRGIGVRLNQGLNGSLTYLFATWALPNGDLLGSTSHYFWYDQTQGSTDTVSPGVPLANTDCLVQGFGIFKVAGDSGGSGDVRIEMRVETSGTAGSLRFPSTLVIERIE